MVLVSSGCIDGGKPGGYGDTGVDTDLPPGTVYEQADPDEPSLPCVADQNWWPSTELFLDAVTVSGTESVPSDAYLLIPCYDWAGNQSYLSHAASLDSSVWSASFYGSNPLCYSVADTSYYPSDLDTYDAVGNYRAYFPMPASGDCTEYGVVHFDFDYHTNAYMMMPSSRSEGPSCAPGSGQFRLLPKMVRDNDGDGDAIVELMAAQISGPAFPERAWLRGVTVNQFGSAGNVKLVKQGFQASLAGEALSPANAAVNVAPGAGTVNLPVGAAVMGTRFLTEQVPTGQIFTPPTVTLNWTCEANPAYTPYGGVPFTLAGSAIQAGLAPSTKLALRVDATNHKAFFKIVGRGPDEIVLELTGNGPTFAFDQLVMGAQASVAGTITLQGTSAVVSFSRLQVSGIDHGTPTWTLTQGQ